MLKCWIILEQNIARVIRAEEKLLYCNKSFCHVGLIWLVVAARLIWLEVTFFSVTKTDHNEIPFLNKKSILKLPSFGGAYYNLTVWSKYFWENRKPHLPNRRPFVSKPHRLDKFYFVASSSRKSKFSIVFVNFYKCKKQFVKVFFINNAI